MNVRSLDKTFPNSIEEDQSKKSSRGKRRLLRNQIDREVNNHPGKILTYTSLSRAEQLARNDPSNMTESENEQLQFSVLNDVLDTTSENHDFKGRTRRSMDFDLHEDVEKYLNLKGTDKDVSRTRCSKHRRSMDLECHDSLDNINADSALSKEEINNSTKRSESTRSWDSFDSDEDSFADADSDCQPNQMYLDEMLEDIHPDRLNLLDYRPSSIRSLLSRTKNEMDESLHNSRYGHGFDLDSTGASNRDRSGRNTSLKKLDEDSDTETDLVDDEEDDDVFDMIRSTTIGDNQGQRNGVNKHTFGSSAGVGPGRPMLRQPSCKTAWGK